MIDEDEIDKIFKVGSSHKINIVENLFCEIYFEVLEKAPLAQYFAKADLLPVKFCFSCIVIFSFFYC